VEQVHQPGLATADRAPEVQALGGAALVQGFEAACRAVDGRRLGGVGDEASVVEGLMVEGFGVMPGDLMGKGHGTTEERPHRGASPLPRGAGLPRDGLDQPSSNPTFNKAPSLSSVSTYR
jgi:hypothetical protein